MSEAPDVIISGGGLAGLTLALALGQNGYASTIIEPLSAEAQTAPAFDGRASAVARDVQRALMRLGVWGLLPESQEVTSIVVSHGDGRDGPRPFFLHFAEDDADGAPYFHMIENRHLRQALFAALGGMKQVTLHAGRRIAEAQAHVDAVHVRLDNGVELRAPLLVSAEGRDSPLRARFGIGATGWSYGQWGLVATVTHELPHQEIAQEYFLPSGPFAILPMTGQRSSLVWTERSDLAAAYLSGPQEAFDAAIAERFGGYLGAVQCTGPRWGYPLRLHLARAYTAARFALIGDAAHVVHPLAGQGLNLALRDVAALAETIIGAGRLGLDWGTPMTLERYQSWRRFDAVAMAAVTEGLNTLFSNDVPGLGAVRGLGLGAVNAIEPLRRFLARAAAGAPPPGMAAPRLLAGEAI